MNGSGMVMRRREAPIVSVNVKQRANEPTGFPVVRVTEFSLKSFRKLPSRFNGIVLPFLLSIIMCGIVSGISTLQAIGLAPDLASQWLQGWVLSWPVAFPVLPFVRRLTGVFVEAPGR